MRKSEIRISKSETNPKSEFGIEENGNTERVDGKWQMEDGSKPE